MSFIQYSSIHAFNFDVFMVVLDFAPHESIHLNISTINSLTTWIKNFQFYKPIAYFLDSSSCFILFPYCFDYPSFEYLATMYSFFHRFNVSFDSILSMVKSQQIDFRTPRVYMRVCKSQFKETEYIYALVPPVSV